MMPYTSSVFRFWHFSHVERFFKNLNGDQRAAIRTIEFAFYDYTDHQLKKLITMFEGLRLLKLGDASGYNTNRSRWEIHDLFAAAMQSNLKFIFDGIPI